MRILFIGNSHTFYNGLPFQVRELLRLQQPTVEVSMHAIGGITLGEHALQPATQMAIQYHTWDYIVLQQKAHPFDGVDVLRRDCRALQPYWQKTAARVLLYMTWAEKRQPTNQVILNQAFTQVAEEIGATLIPVSKAWQYCLQTAPEFELYDSDGEHASSLGSYLAACVFYAVLQQASPVGLPARLYARDAELVNLVPETAARLQQAAWWAVQPTRRAGSRLFAKKSKWR